MSPEGCPSCSSRSRRCPPRSIARRARERLELLAGHLVAETRRISDGAFTLAERAVEVRHARSRADRRVTFVSMGVFAFFAIAISMLVFRRVLRPMAGLEATARAFRDGNLAARSNYRARDEFGDLSSTFDAMARALQERTARLDTAQVELKNTLNAIPSVIGYWDRTLHNRFANRAYLAWFGIGQEHMSGMHMRDVLRASYDETEPFIEAVLRGEPQIFERTLPRPRWRGRAQLLDVLRAGRGGRRGARLLLLYPRHHRDQGGRESLAAGPRSLRHRGRFGLYRNLGIRPGRQFAGLGRPHVPPVRSGARERRRALRAMGVERASGRPGGRGRAARHGAARRARIRPRVPHRLAERRGHGI